MKHVVLCVLVAGGAVAGALRLSADSSTLAAGPSLEVVWQYDTKG